MTPRAMNTTKQRETMVLCCEHFGLHRRPYRIDQNFFGSKTKRALKVRGLIDDRCVPTREAWEWFVPIPIHDFDRSTVMRSSWGLHLEEKDRKILLRAEPVIAAFALHQLGVRPTDYRVRDRWWEEHEKEMIAVSKSCPIYIRKQWSTCGGIEAPGPGPGAFRTVRIFRAGATR